MTDGTWWWGAGIVMVLAAACAPQSIEFEHVDGGAGRGPGDGTGGSLSPDSGSPGTGGTDTGATGGTTGSAGMPGHAGTGTISGPEPELDTACDYKAIVTSDCAKGGCHKGGLAAAELSLAVDHLVANLKDVPPSHLGIQCSAPTAPYFECIPAGCPTDVLLVDSTHWEQSWLITKLRGNQGTCGDQMPDTDYRLATPAREACIESMVKAIAALPTQ